MQTAQIDDWLNKAFKLAFFIHGRRDIVKQIAASAMNKLETASNAQFKRYYYTPTGRAETSRATRSRVSLNDLQLLQRLVFVESENFEKQNETAKTTSEKKLARLFHQTLGSHFIKAKFILCNARHQPHFAQLRHKRRDGNLQHRRPRPR